MKAAMDEAEAWDARAGYEIGSQINRFLALNPPPAGTALADDLIATGQLLEEAGRRELEQRGARVVTTTESRWP